VFMRICMLSGLEKEIYVIGGVQLFGFINPFRFM
jgi:hypothetical protein